MSLENAILYATASLSFDHLMSTCRTASSGHAKCILAKDGTRAGLNKSHKSNTVEGADHDAERHGEYFSERRLLYGSSINRAVCRWRLQARRLSRRRRLVPSLALRVSSGAGLDARFAAASTRRLRPPQYTYSHGTLLSACFVSLVFLYFSTPLAGCRIAFQAPLSLLLALSLFCLATS